MFLGAGWAGTGEGLAFGAGAARHGRKGGKCRGNQDIRAFKPSFISSPRAGRQTPRTW
jgi:hypothetical protein